jgi:glycyl-tRNA synthetase beta chain
MSNLEDFLLEIHTEELPPKSLVTLAQALLSEMEKQLQKANLAFSASEYYATPRRLAVLIKNLEVEQSAQVIERKGPALSAAFDANGKPTPACLGFARSCGVEPEALMTIKAQNGEWVGYKETVAGKASAELLPAMIQSSLSALPIPKRMRWGNSEDTFIRPVHAVIALLGNKVVNTTLLGCSASHFTYGHRFHYPQAIKINHPQEYVTTLADKAYVIADFAARRKIIREQAEAVVKSNLQQAAQVLFDDKLLDEVTGIVEWPVAIFGSFDSRFLSVPTPVLISAMQDHQRYFPVVDQQGKLLPYFAAISNIASQDIPRVVAGNERVLRARLSDASFFFETDKKKKLADRVEALKGIIFQAKLGTLQDKTQRLIKLLEFMQADASVIRAALLCKADLTSEMVGEFPELQGVMGYYYAKHDGETEVVAQAIVDHYKPRFSGDILPTEKSGCLLALADRIDTLVGIFGINQIPTGDKDPFGLRRAAIGVLRILIEKEMDIDLGTLLNYAASCFGNLENKEVVPQLLKFMQDRLKSLVQEQGYTSDVFAAVAALNITRPYDMYQRIKAVQSFKQLPDAESLAMANKRVSNILTQCQKTISMKAIDVSLLSDDAEKTLVSSMAEQESSIAPLYQGANYVEVLSHLAHLRGPVDKFFDQVLVMVDDKKLRENRLLILQQLRSLFLQVADIAFLAVK